MPLPSTVVHRLGRHAFNAATGTMTRPHLHPEIEFNLLLSGSAGYETPGGTVPLPPGRLLVFWGGHPHRLVGAGPLEMLGVTMPLSDTAGQAVLSGPTRALLSGRWLTGEQADGPGDALLLRRWRDDLRRRPTADICLLEMQARLARLGAADASPATGSPHSDAGERLLLMVARHFAEPISVADLAGRAGVHPTYAAKVFTETFGMPMWRYVEQLRIAQAQHLLRTTDWPVDRIAHECGYRSRSGFYRAFTGLLGSSPAHYRRTR
ncbi:AraC family transcriptional regulator [Actinoplanes sp. CA-030573]|uniref:AraC family transcriptional regulator n=1 Tax=Actinoplanes sp. CA-030573 TaxID=3239898 RepID=UPI003D928695